MTVQTIDMVIASVAHMDPDSAQPYLKDLGVSIITAIRITNQAFGIDLGEAKKIVALHPAWGFEAHQGDQLHEEILNNLP